MNAPRWDKRRTTYRQAKGYTARAVNSFVAALWCIHNGDMYSDAFLARGRLFFAERYADAALAWYERRELEPEPDRTRRALLRAKRERAPGGYRASRLGWAR